MYFDTNSTMAAGTVTNGNSNISIPAANGNVLISSAGNANILVITGTGVNVAGTLNTGAGNANIGNIGTAQVLASANITSPQLISNITTGTAPLVVTSTTQVANLNVATAGTVTSSSQGNITSVGTIANLTVTNVNFTGYKETVIAGGNTSTSITPNVAAGTIFNYTANSNFTFNSLTSAVAGSSAVVIITQDATGSRTLTSTMKFSGASKTLSTAANSIDIISVFYDGTNYYATLSKGYA